MTEASHPGAWVERLTMRGIEDLADGLLRRAERGISLRSVWEADDEAEGHAADTFPPFQLFTPVLHEERIDAALARAAGAPIAFVLADGDTSSRLDEAGLVDLHQLTIATAAAVGSGGQ